MGEKNNINPLMADSILINKVLEKIRTFRENYSIHFIFSIRVQNYQDSKTVLDLVQFIKLNLSLSAVVFENFQREIFP